MIEKIHPGDVVGRLTVTSRDYDHNGSKPYYWCECACGTIKSVRGDHLRTGKTTSCRCQHSEIMSVRNFVHGLRYDPLYNRWHHMNDRCNNQSNPEWVNYGGRGIKVCPEWCWNNPYGLANFIAWNLSLSSTKQWCKGLELDRRSNNGNYEPGNCHWTTSSRQKRNMRTTVIVPFRNHATPLIDVFDTLSNEGSIPNGVTYEMVKSRYNSGWNLRDSLLSPPVRKLVGGRYESS